METNLLNNYKMNDAIKILKEALAKEEHSHFALQCENCTISIVATNLGKETIEVALRSTDNSKWIPLEMDGFTEERPIIHTLPLIAFPAFVKQFHSLKAEDFSEVWDAWDTISCYS